MASKTRWASGKNIVFHQCKTCWRLPTGQPLFVVVTFCQVSQKSHDRKQVKLIAEHRGPMEVATFSDTPVAYCGFIRLLCSCT